MSNDFDWTDDYDKMTCERVTDHGVFRAVVERDDYAEAPDFEYGCPVFRVARRAWTGYHLDDTPELGRESWKNDGIPHDMSEVWERLSDLPAPGWIDTIDHVDRYLRIFHGGGAKLISSTIHQGGDDFLVYDTRAMRQSWGQTGEMLETSDPEGDEWQAYLDNEVFVIRVDKACEFDMDGDPTEWETVDGPVGGYYGERWAQEEALEMLDWAIEDAASQMLPIEMPEVG